MLVSVAIPTYNAADYLREAIESVLAQTYRPIEIIVVDDGSTDHTKDICKSFGSKVRYIYQENDGTKGPGARARAVLESKGEWIAILDHDDRWLPEKIEKQIKLAENHPEVGAVFTAFRQIDKDGKVLRAFSAESLSGDVFHELLKRPLCLNSSAIVRRAAIARCGLPNTETFVADFAWWLSLGRHYPFLFLDEVLTEERTHPNNTARDRAYVATESIRVLELQNYRLHPGCRDCKVSLKKGLKWWAKYGAGYFLNRFHERVMIGEFHNALSDLWQAVKLSPSTVLKPLRVLAAVKNAILGARYFVSERPRPRDLKSERQI